MIQVEERTQSTDQGQRQERCGMKHRLRRQCQALLARSRSGRPAHSRGARAHEGPVRAWRAIRGLRPTHL